MASPTLDPQRLRSNELAEGVTDACRVCGMNGNFDRYELREMLFGTRQPFEYSRCPACGVLQIVTVPPDLGRYYPPEYFGASETARSGRASSGLRQFARSRRNSILLFRSGLLRSATKAVLGDGRDTVGTALTTVRRAGLRSFADPILDVGCGRVPGYLRWLRDIGFRDLTGIDPFLEEELDQDGIRLRRQSIHECDGKFQFVTMHHSFEHVPDPVEVMRSAQRVLRPGGVLLIRTPVMGTWFWDTYRTAWWELDAPRHLFVHTAESLRICAAAAGLTHFDTVWDSTVAEVIASEQISRGIAWREPNSWAINPPAGVTDEILAHHEREVRALNAAGNAGRAGFYFQLGQG